MKESDQVKAIAYSLGYRPHSSDSSYAMWYTPNERYFLLERTRKLPDFLNDRDAIIEAVDKLTDQEFSIFEQHLSNICALNFNGSRLGKFRLMLTATAAQICKAYLLALGLWTDSTATKEGVE